MEKIDKSDEEFLFFISSDYNKTNSLLSKMNYYKLLMLDLDSKSLEAKVALNIKKSKGLLIYVGQNNFLANGYVINIINRFKSLKKHVVFLYDDELNKNIAYDDDWININDKTYLDQIVSSLSSNVGAKRNNEIKTVINDGSEIVSILDDSDVITIPLYATSIRSRAGYDKNISRLVIPCKNKFEIKEYAFYNGRVKEIEINQPDSQIIIGQNAFYNVTSLEKIIISSNNIEIKLGAFMGCSHLNTLSVNDKNIIVREHAFEETGFKELYLNKATLIEKYAFKNAKELLWLTISSDTKVEDYVSNASNLTVNILGGNESGMITDKSFSPNTKIKIKKNLKKYYNELNKKVGKIYNISLLKD